MTLLALSVADLAEIIEQEPEIGHQLRIMAGATEDMEKVRHLRRLNLMAGLGSEQLARWRSISALSGLWPARGSIAAAPSAMRST